MDADCSLPRLCALVEAGWVFVMILPSAAAIRGGNPLTCVSAEVTVLAALITKSAVIGRNNRDHSSRATTWRGCFQRT